MYIIVNSKLPAQNGEHGGYVQLLLLSTERDSKQFGVVVWHNKHLCGYIGIQREIWTAAQKRLSYLDESKLDITFQGIGRDLHQLPGQILETFDMTQPTYWLGTDWTPAELENIDDNVTAFESWADRIMTRVNQELAGAFS